MKSLSTFLILCLACCSLYAQSPGYMGHKTLIAFTKSATLGENRGVLSIVSSPMFSVERLFARHWTAGISTEILKASSDEGRYYNEQYNYLEGDLKATSTGGGLFVKWNFFRASNLLPPLGPYWRLDFQMFGATTKFSSNRPFDQFTNANQDITLSRYLVSSVGLALGSSTVILERVVLDFGIRAKVISPFGISLYQDQDRESNKNLLQPELRKLDFLKAYAGIGILL
jgi:hypothetical protein